MEICFFEDSQNWEFAAKQQTFIKIIIPGGITCLGVAFNWERGTGRHEGTDSMGTGWNKKIGIKIEIPQLIKVCAIFPPGKARYS